MSIVVAVRVGEGLVVAADSASTLMGRSPDGQVGVVKVFNHATKLLQLKDYPIAVASWGAGAIGARTISSLVDEYANDRPKYDEVSDSLSVETEAQGLLAFLVKQHRAQFPDPATGAAAGLGVFVGGYSGTAFFPDEFVFSVPQGDIKPLRPSSDKGGQNFGANWYGLTDAVVRLHFGRDERLPAILKAKGVSDEIIREVEKTFLEEIQFPVPFDGMPLQDAADYAMYLVGCVVGRFRFVVGPELCGGPIDVAAITRGDGFRWVHRKKVAARPFGPQL